MPSDACKKAAAKVQHEVEDTRKALAAMRIAAATFRKEVENEMRSRGVESDAVSIATDTIASMDTLSSGLNSLYQTSQAFID